jgi:ABC-type ATPase with predicted acetyltransferase domain
MVENIRRVFMGKLAVFNCLDCNTEFSATEGGGFITVLYRCINCDATEIVGIEKVTRSDSQNSQGNPYVVSYSHCKKCGGEMRNDLAPMCTNCKSRNNEIKNIIMFYD